MLADWTVSEKIIIAIIASSATIFGVLISQGITLFVAHRNRKHEREVLLRNKYEELMLHFSNSIEWVVQLHNSKSKEELFSRSQSIDARKALSLSLLYFPDLVDEINKYIISMQEYYGFAVTIFDQSIMHNAGAQVLVHQDGKKLLDHLLSSKNSLENLIVKKSEKYTRV